MDIIPKEFNLSNSDEIDEASLLQIILERVNYLLEHDVDLLMSYLYRLDIEESKINSALSLGSVLPANEGIAKLILERQKKRMETKKKYKQKPIQGWEF